MIQDIATVVWKEWKELFLQRGGIRSGWANLLIFLGVLGVFLPLQFREWLTNPIMPLMWTWMPVFMAMSVITDAFAGERERHTLETLLASRLSDQAILLGKLAAAVLYAWGIAVIGLLVGAITINIAYPSGGLQFYPAGTFLLAISLSFLASLLLSGIGVLVSLRAASARQAYQRMSVALLAIYFLPTFAPMLLPQSVKDSLSLWFTRLDIETALIVGLGVLLVIDIILVAAGLARFQRSKLMVGIE